MTHNAGTPKVTRIADRVDASSTLEAQRELVDSSTKRR